MFGISGFELLIILVFGFILAGDRLPEVAKTLGRALKTFRNAQRDMSAVIRNDVFDPTAEEPFKDPMAALDKMSDVAKKAGSSLKDNLDEVTSTLKKPKPAAASVVVIDESAQEAPAEAAVEVEAVGGEGAAEPAEPAVETFAQRRARYERERAERLAAEAAAAAAAQVVSENAAEEAADDAGKEA